MMEDQLPDRVRRAEENREFRQLLEQSSIGKSPKGFEREPNIGSGQCQPCHDDRCADVGCALPHGCACPCTADKRSLADDITAVLAGRNMWYHEDDVAELVDTLYGKGWRRE